MGDVSDHMEWAAGFDEFDMLTHKHKPRTTAQIKHPHARYGGSAALAKFAENLGPWLTLESVKNFGPNIRAKFSTTAEKLKVAGDVKKLAKQCGCSDVSIYNDAVVSYQRWITVKFPVEADYGTTTVPRSRHEGHHLNDHKIDIGVRAKIKAFEKRTEHALRPVALVGRKKNAIVVHYAWNGNDLSSRKEYEDCGVIALQHFVAGENGSQRVAVVFQDTTEQPSKKVKKMNEDFEFYLALLQSSGVKMVEVTLDTRNYNYLCAIDVTVGQNVIVQARDQMMVGQITDVLEDWDMDIVEEFGEDLKWVVNTVDISNAKLYADQKKQVFEQLRQSRLVEKAKKFAGASNLNFDSLVKQTQDRLAISHDDVLEPPARA